ncbi:MAG: hypothetical protein COB29_00955 [Sulfitobacter sp.]|nr:MAG: hypothetical protein COB29_00955 [Sulfitobacter sp.]
MNEVLSRGVNANKLVNDTYNWPRQISKIIKGYNDTWQKTIKMSPLKAEKDWIDGVENQIPQRLGASANARNQDGMTVLSKGDQVRIRLNHDKKGGVSWTRGPFVIEESFIEKLSNGNLIPSYQLQDIDSQMTMRGRYGSDQVLKYIPSETKLKMAPLYIVSYLIKPLWRTIDGEKHKYWVVRWLGYKDATYEAHNQLMEDVPKVVQRFELLRNVKWNTVNHTVTFLPAQRKPHLVEEQNA